MSKALSLQPRHSVALSMVAALLGTALVSPLYPLYQDAWGLSAGDVSNLYVIYMIGALSGLVFLGRLGDRIGYTATLVAALLLALVGSVICMAAQGMTVLAIGRFMVGIAGTMATSAGAAGYINLTPPERKANATLKCSLLVSFGFGAGPVIGGIVGQWMPMPLVVAHVPSIVSMLLAVVLMSRIEPRMPVSELKGRLSLRDFMPALTWPKGDTALVFALASVLPFITFGVFGLYASMAPSIVRNVLGLGGPVVSGLGIAFILTGSCITQIVFKRMHYGHSALIGLGMLALSNGLMIFNLGSGSAMLFSIGLCATAIGHGASMFAGSQVVNLIADHTNRSSLTASYWAVGYCGSIVPMIGTGIMADLWGMNLAVTVFCSTVVVMCVVGLVLFLLAQMTGRTVAADVV